MQPAIYIKKSIDFNKNFKGLLEVLKLVAVSEYHNLERKLRSFERLKDILGEFFDAVDLRAVRHPFLTASGAPVVLAVTSDGGLLGGINMQVVSRAVEIVRAEGGSLVVMGERGTLYAMDSGLPFEHYPGVHDAKRLEQAYEMREALAQKVLTGRAGGIKVVYPRAASFVLHRVETATLLPFSQGEGAVPGGKDPIILESTPDEVVEYLVYLILGQRLYEIFGMARVCEQAARFLHLEESCNKIGEMNKKNWLQYFRRRHEIIDSNMRELFSSRSAFKKK